MKLAKNERLLLYLLSRALRGERGRVSYFPEEAERIAANHGVLPLLFDVVSPPEGSGMARATMQCVQQSYHLLVASRRYAALLQEGGCAVAVLKGASIAAVYPVPEYRKSGDLDILLLRRQDFERADAILRSAGAVVQESQHANHHVAYDLPEGFDLELHMSLVEDFDNKSVNRTLAVMQERMPYATRTVLGAELPVLEDGEQALSLLLHMLQHYLRAGFGLKLLCDWVCFWKGGVAKEQRERYRSHIERLGLEGFSEMVTDACCRYLGLPRNAVADLPRSSVKLPLTGWSFCGGRGFWTMSGSSIIRCTSIFHGQDAGRFYGRGSGESRWSGFYATIGDIGRLAYFECCKPRKSAASYHQFYAYLRK